MKDLYATLGVAATATDDEIKKAYRKLAMEHHPDRNLGDKSAEDRFKTINEAYSTLGDPSKRAGYDNQRRHGGGQNGFRQGQGRNEFHFDFGGDPGMAQFDDIIRQFFNQQGFGGPFDNHHGVRRNRDLQLGIDITLEDAFAGKDMPVGFEVGGNQTNIVVRIPSGVDSGTRMRFQGHGDRSMANLPPGDLYATVNVIQHPIFRRDGPHLHCELKVDAIDAMLGCNQDISCIDGTRISMAVPPGTQHGTVMRMAGKGMPAHHNATQRGELYASISITIPRDLTDEQKLTLAQMASERRR